MFTEAHLLWAVMTTVYICIAVFCFEEPRLVQECGQTYVQFQQERGAFCPFVFEKKKISRKRAENFEKSKL